MLAFARFSSHDLRPSLELIVSRRRRFETAIQRRVRLFQAFQFQSRKLATVLHVQLLSRFFQGMSIILRALAGVSPSAALLLCYYKASHLLHFQLFLLVFELTISAH